MYQKILVGLDGSAGSFRALRAAIAIARACGAALHSLSVDEIPQHAGAVLPMDNEHEWGDTPFAPDIRRALRQCDEAGIALYPHVVIGHEVKATAQFIEAGGFDLLVIGFVGRSDLSEQSMGGSCFGLTQHAPCSVLVVK